MAQALWSPSIPLLTHWQLILVSQQSNLSPFPSCNSFPIYQPLNRSLPPAPAPKSSFVSTLVSNANSEIQEYLKPHRTYPPAITDKNVQSGIQRPPRPDPAHPVFLLSHESLAPFPSALLFTALCRDQNALACPLVLLTNASHLLTLTQASHPHKSFLRQKRKGMCFPQMHPKIGPCLFSPPSIIPDMMGALELERLDLPTKSGSVS